ncbi:MAG: 6-carboxytetrahydropterin synthase [Bdellovibrionota bacterium]
MLTCTKIWDDLTFTHRQYSHQSKCSRIHGHNWKLELTFACKETDNYGFVIDYSALEYINDWIRKNLDHTNIFAEQDPALSVLHELESDLFQIVVVQNSSTEGIAEFIHDSLNPMVLSQTKERAWMNKVKLWEFSKTGATYIHSAFRNAECPPAYSAKAT